MARFSAVLILIGTFSCSALALDSKPAQIDRAALRQAIERWIAEYPGFVPDLRSTAPPIKEQLRRIDEWRKQHPCPATKRTTGACPGYVIGGATDKPRWETRTQE
jgi:hypothetical protein